MYVGMFVSAFANAYVFCMCFGRKKRAVKNWIYFFVLSYSFFLRTCSFCFWMNTRDILNAMTKGEYTMMMVAADCESSTFCLNKKRQLTEKWTNTYHEKTTHGNKCRGTERGKNCVVEIIYTIYVCLCVFVFRESKKGNGKNENEKQIDIEGDSAQVERGWGGAEGGWRNGREIMLKQTNRLTSNSLKFH